MIKKNEYYPLFMKMRKNELGVNEISAPLEKLTNKNLISLYKEELLNIDNLIIFIEFLKEFICIFCHKYKYENQIEEMFELYSNMLDDFYTKENNMKHIDKNGENIDDFYIKENNDLNKLEENKFDLNSNIQVGMHFGNENYFNEAHIKNDRNKELEIIPEN